MGLHVHPQVAPVTGKGIPLRQLKMKREVGHGEATRTPLSCEEKRETILQNSSEMLHPQGMHRNTSFI